MPSKSTLWAQHDKAWRHPGQVMAQWPSAEQLNPKLLQYVVDGDWWQAVAKSRSTFLISREYEHLAMAMTILRGAPHVSTMAIPHPSGIAVDRKRGIVYIASTRNPNQIFELSAVHSLRHRADIPTEPLRDSPLIPLRTQFLPGCLYIHDLAVIGGKLHAAAAGLNAIVSIEHDGSFQRVWSPRSLAKKGSAAFLQNYLQLNSIAAGRTVKDSCFSASAEFAMSLRPGHPEFPVDRQGVIFSGKTRQVIARGLTRPHSARWHRGKLWVNNSGYGEVGIAENGRFRPVMRFTGWTRGLCFVGDIAFVGVSRVLPRFRAYAPGLAVDKSHCGIYALNTKTGNVIGSIRWPYGNQIFAIEAASRAMTSGFAFASKKGSGMSLRSNLFYAFSRSSKGVSL